MPTLLQQINAAQWRRPAVMYAPRRPMPTQRTNARPPVRRARSNARPIGWTASEEAFANSPAARRKQEEGDEEPEQKGFWGSDFGKGLGFVINNPVTRAVSMPVNYFQTGQRLVALGLEEAAEALAGNDTAQQLIQSVPALKSTIGAVDTTRTEKDTRSNWSKVASPTSTFGGGDLIRPTGNEWFDRIAGFGIDVATDPLTYVGGGAPRLVEGASQAARAAEDLVRARRALQLVEEGGDARKIATATDRVAAAERYAEGVGHLTQPQQWSIPLPRNRAERISAVGDLTATPAGRRILTEMPEEVQRATTRGFQVAAPEVRAALGVAEPGLRVRGFDAALPGTGRLANRLNRVGGGVRHGIAVLPGSERKLANIRTPRGLEESFNTLSRYADGDVLTAASEVYARQHMRTGGGPVMSRGARKMANALREGFKGKSKAAMRKLVAEAETSSEPNFLNHLGADILNIYQDVTGTTLNSEHLLDPNTYLPHLMHPRWRRFLATAAKRKDQAALDFIEQTGLVQDELLEDAAFYVDNMMEGSGFLSKSRKIGPNEDGTPRTMRFGSREVTFERNDIGHLNEQLAKAFPHFKGEFYNTDPATIFENYITSLSRQAGRDLAARKLVEVGNPLVGTMTGDVDATRLAMNEALSQQGAGPLLSTAQGKYDPTQPLPATPETPIVPGSAQDKARRAVLAESQADLAAARSPEEAMAAQELLDVTPAPAERFGDVDPNDYFRTTVSSAATAARDADAKRAATYARAAVAETRKADTRLRQALADIKTELVTPVRTTIDETKKQITAINKAIKGWAKQVTDLGPLTSNNLDDVTLLMSQVDEQILNIETKIRRTKATWKGQATRQQRKAEQELRKSLDSLHKIYTQAKANARRAPERMQAELTQRLEILNKPVRDAQEALLRAEISVPVPHGQAAVEAARSTIESQIGNVDPDVLIGRYREILADVRNRAELMAKSSAFDSPELAEMRQDYGRILQQIEDIRTRPRRRGQLSKANQKALDGAVAKRNQLALKLGQAVQPLSAYDAAQLEMAYLRDQLARFGTPSLEQQMSDMAVDSALEPFGGGSHSPQRLVREAVEGVDADEIQASLDTVRHSVVTSLADRVDRNIREHFDWYQRPNALSEDDWMKFLGRVWDQLPRDVAAELETLGIRSIGPDPSTLRQTRAALANYEKRFQPGGIFYDEQQARATVFDMDTYEADVAKATTTQRAALEKANAERSARQESIIWANDNKSRRLITAPGQPRNQLEQMGWGPGGQRFPEAITTPPQGTAWSQIEEPPIQNVVGRRVSERGETVQAPDVVNRPRPVPPPRTEVEALQSLEGQLEYGSPSQQARQVEVQRAQRELRDKARRAPSELEARKMEIAEAAGREADNVTGPLNEQAKTFQNLATDLANKRQLVAKRDELIDLRARLNQVKPGYRNRDLDRTIDDLESIAQANPLLDDQKLAQVESLLQTHRTELQRIRDTGVRANDLDRATKDALDGKLGPVMIASLDDTWRAMHHGPLNTGDIIMDAELHRRFNNLHELNRSKLLGRTFNAFTNLFKTYATLSPGFFLRNTIGGIFMNTSDGVGLLAQAEGADLWGEWMKNKTGRPGRRTARNADEWLAQQPKRVQDAFDAAWTTGAGGRYEDTGVAARTNSRAYNFAASNWLVRKAQRFGTRVEGAMRLGMALDSIDKGMSVTQTVDRISRVHFDYGQVSELDDTMKRIIPFWTFMSRNLPLQIQQQWTNPRVYSYYDHLVTNFSMPDEEFTPDYWTRQGAWRTPVEIGGNPVYLQPDLGFNRVQSDIKLMSDALSGDNVSALFAQTNPALGASVDFATHRDSFYDRTYTDADYKKMTGPVGALLTMIGKPLNQTNKAGQVSENFTNYLSSLIPPLNQAMRLMPEATGGETSADTRAKWARYLGIPMQLLTPAMQESEYWRQWREMQDEMDVQQAMARESVS